MDDIDPAPRLGGMLSISRSLQALAVVVVVLIVAATVHQLLTGRATILADTEHQMARLDMVFAEQTGRAVETVDFILRNAVETFLSLRAKPPIDAQAYDGWLGRRIAGVRQVREVGVTDKDGHVLFSSRPGPIRELPPALRTFVAAHAAQADTGLQFSDPARGPDGQWAALMLRPILAHDGAFEGAAIAFLNLGYFEDFYRAVELNESGAILLHLRDGTVLARYPHYDAVIGESYGDLPPFKDILTHGIAGTVIMDSPIDGSRRVLAIRALKAFPLAVNVSVAQKQVLAAWRRQTWTFSLVAVGASTAVFGLLLLLAQRSRQVEALLGEYRAAKDEAEDAHRRLVEQMAERERAEAALRQAQRIEAVGQLTGGVAHDFNNLLTVLIGNIDLIRRAPTLDPLLAERLAAMRAAAERGAMLTSHLLAFSRRQPLSPRPVDLNALVSGMQGLLQSALGPRVQIEARLAPDLWPTMVDPTQFELVLLNLVINARDAMPEGGVMTVATTNVHRGPPVRPEEAAEGDYVSITVRDVGNGMTPEVQAKAFEPFFTTKRPGAGSGLGLSQVFGTAHQSGGDVRIDSAPGKGTAVTVCLPRAASEAEASAIRYDEWAEQRASDAVVLVVDDDEAVRLTTAEILTDLGYTVVQAASGNAALELLDRSRMIDVLLTDVVMTGMSGPDLARQARRAHPYLPIIFISGYADLGGIGGDGRAYRLIRKPFRPLDLRRQIEAALAETRTPAGPAAP
jgi:signal transduction histidine kinase